MANANVTEEWKKLSFESIRWNMWPKYVQSRNESLKLKHGIKKKQL